MVYGRKNSGMRRGVRGSTRRTYRKKVPVPKAKKSPRTFARTTARGVNSNFRMLKQIQMKMLGHVQKNYHEWPVRLSPTATSPICFDATDFSRNLGQAGAGCAVFNLNQLGQVAVATNFRTQPLCSSGNPFWEGTTADIPDTGRFTPIYAKYHFKIEGTAATGLDNVRVHIQMFSMKAKALTQTLNTGNAAVVMPQAMKHLTNMADPTKNRLSNDFFKKYKSTWVFLNSQLGGTSGVKGTTGNIFYRSMTIRPKKTRTQKFTSPIVAGSTIPEPLEGHWGANHYFAAHELWAQ